jgi:hypothetical protein
MLTVENGTMLEGANSYASVAQADGYLYARGNEDWPQHVPEEETDPDTGEMVTTPDPNLAAKEAALIRATDYLNGLNWYGKRAAGGRVMAWPRVEAVDCDGYAIAEDTVPDTVVLATCALAGIIYGGEDAQPTLERGGRIQSESVGPLSQSFFDDAANRTIFAAIADLLRCLTSDFDAYAGAGNAKAGRGGVVCGRVVAG